MNQLRAMSLWHILVRQVWRSDGLENGMIALGSLVYRGVELGRS
jgi:hypothetical protein